MQGFIGLPHGLSQGHAMTTPDSPHGTTRGLNYNFTAAQLLPLSGSVPVHPQWTLFLGALTTKLAQTFPL